MKPTHNSLPDPPPPQIILMMFAPQIILMILSFVDLPSERPVARQRVRKGIHKIDRFLRGQKIVLPISLTSPWSPLSGPSPSPSPPGSPAPAACFRKKKKLDFLKQNLLFKGWRPKFTRKNILFNCRRPRFLKVVSGLSETMLFARILVKINVFDQLLSWRATSGDPPQIILMMFWAEWTNFGKKKRFATEWRNHRNSCQTPPKELRPPTKY